MGIFSHSSSFDQVVEKATQETNTKEDWAVIMDICDKVSTSPEAPKQCFRAIIKRLHSQDPHVSIQAITLLEACVSNCGHAFHLEIASREFETEAKKFLTRANLERAVRDKFLKAIQRWAENEFKSNPQLDLIPALYSKLLGSYGHEYPPSDAGTSKSSKKHHHHHQKAKQEVSSSGATSSTSAAQQEADDLAKAIELSLKEQSSPPNRSLYPSVLNPDSSYSTAKKDKELRKVRALYDFEAVEENELTFYAGEMVHVIDDSDTNWWEGTNQRGTGLFPANFVTADLSAEPQRFESATKKQVQFNDEVEVKTVDSAGPQVLEVDESKIDTVLNILHEADPTGRVRDPPELGPLEEQVTQMGPLIDTELEKIDRRHAQLTRLGSELVDALNMYHNLMRESLPQVQFPNYNKGPSASVPNFHSPPYQPYPSYEPNRSPQPLGAPGNFNVVPPHGYPNGGTPVGMMSPSHSMGQIPNMNIPQQAMNMPIVPPPNVTVNMGMPPGSVYPPNPNFPQQNNSNSMPMGNPGMEQQAFWAPQPMQNIPPHDFTSS